PQHLHGHLCDLGGKPGKGCAALRKFVHGKECSAQGTDDPDGLTKCCDQVPVLGSCFHHPLNHPGQPVIEHCSGCAGKLIPSRCGPAQDQQCPGKLAGGGGVEACGEQFR